MNYFRHHYAEPSLLLSMERAREYDRVSEFNDFEEQPEGDRARLVGIPSSPNGMESRRRNFDKDSYRQPVLSEKHIEPLPYRRGREDELTMKAKELLSRINGADRANSRNESASAQNSISDNSGTRLTAAV